MGFDDADGDLNKFNLDLLSTESTSPNSMAGIILPID